MSVRVRYAPSPTGRLHVGNLRAALFDILFARHESGTAILRIEDTDRTRYSPEAETYQAEALAWLGLDFDESPQKGGPFAPYHQSQRKEAGIYAPYVQQLLNAGHAYLAFDTPEELESMREFQQINKQPIGYFGGVWRTAEAPQIEEAKSGGKPGVVRLKIPRNTVITIQDLVRGRIEWDSNEVDDPVLIKADGMPTYHFAAMVDDHLMEVTHIIRGEEWISSAPKHAHLFDCFGWQRPTFVHCPVIKGKDGKKLAKRHGATSVLDYKYQGFLPHALLNFIALIGWSPTGDRELLTMPELIEAFDLARIQPSPGVFDFDKLKWMNGHYIRSMTPKELAATVRDYLADPNVFAFYEAKDEELVREDLGPGLAMLATALKEQPDLAERAIELEQPRVTTLAEFGEATAFFFQDEPPMDPKAVEKWFKEPHCKELFGTLIKHLEALPEISVEDCEKWVREFAANAGLEKLGPIVHPIRVALTGKTYGPGLFELMSALGPKCMVQRLLRAQGLLP